MKSRYFLSETVLVNRGIVLVYYPPYLVDQYVFDFLLLISVSVDETLLPWYVNLSISFRGLPFSVEMSPVWLKHIYYVVCIDVEADACSGSFQIM